MQNLALQGMAEHAVRMGCGKCESQRPAAIQILPGGRHVFGLESTLLRTTGQVSGGSEVGGRAGKEGFLPTPHSPCGTEQREAH